MEKLHGVLLLWVDIPFGWYGGKRGLELWQCLDQLLVHIIKIRVALVNDPRDGGRASNFDFIDLRRWTGRAEAANI